MTDDPLHSMTNRIDRQRPDAPELAALGPHPVGVRALVLVNPGQIDVLNINGTTLPRYDRALAVEVWYPAAPGTPPGTRYDTILRDGVMPISLHGQACRDAEAATGRFPLVLISHGYPGNRFLMSHLGENLASKGYVVASVDHRDSGYADKHLFGATMINRPLDQAFVIASLRGLEPWAAMLTPEAAIVGYSMGGYGALVSGGAGVSQEAVDHPETSPAGLLTMHQAGSTTHEALIDPSIRAIVAFGPWGRQRGVWDADGMAGLRKPTLIVAGSQDHISGYENGMRLMFDEATGCDRWLLTYDHAGHNAGAPIPPPEEAWVPSPHLDFVPFQHYGDLVWDNVRMNNIAQHYLTAFLGQHLKGQDTAHYLDPNANWPGFAEGSARGLRLEHRKESS
ncbi:MAG: alpha/beta hydrolase family protein [Paracoccaceae bacterium]